jgi:hypothetical protein
MKKNSSGDNSSDCAQKGLSSSLFPFGKGRSLLIRPESAQILTRLTLYKLRRLNGVIRCFRIWVDRRKAASGPPLFGEFNICLVFLAPLGRRSKRGYA